MKGHWSWSAWILLQQYRELVQCIYRRYAHPSPQLINSFPVFSVRRTNILNFLLPYNYYSDQNYNEHIVFLVYDYYINMISWSKLFLFPYQYLVDHTIFQGRIRLHPIIPITIIVYLLYRLSRMLSYNFIQLIF